MTIAELKTALIHASWGDDDQSRDETIVPVLKVFVNEVNYRAEKNMLKTGKLEGSHYAAMRAIMDELEAK